MSLPTRLIVAIAFVLVVVLGIGGALSYRQGLERVEVETQAAMVRAEAAIRSTLDDALAAPDPHRELSHLLRAFDQSRHLRVFLVRTNGLVEASTEPAADGNVPAWFSKVFAPVSTSVLIELQKGFGTAHAVRLQSDPSGEIGELWEEARLDTAMLLGLLSLILGTSFMLLRSALDPLPRLIDAFGRVGVGDYTPRIAVSGPCEFRRLCAKFNEMTERLAAIERENVRLADELMRVQEVERADLARDLHDGLGPLLFAIDIDAMGIEDMDDGEPVAGAKPRVASIRSSAGEMKGHIGTLLGRLRPDVALDLGLASAVEQLVAACGPRNPGIEFVCDVAPDGFGKLVDATMYCVIREGLNNALRHARAGRIEIKVMQSTDDSVIATIADNGIGFQKASPSTGYGLIGMRERIAALGGSLRILSPGGHSGSIVQVMIPRVRLTLGPQPVVLEGPIA